jgi:hypothetical protein
MHCIACKNEQANFVILAQQQGLKMGLSTTPKLMAS